MSPTRLACPYPDFSRVNSPVLVSYILASQKCVLNVIHVFWIGERQFYDLIEYWKFTVLLIIL